MAAIFSQSRIYIEIAGIASNSFFVRSYRSQNLNLSRHYQLYLELHSQQQIAARSLLKRNAKLIITDQTRPNYIHGIIEQCTYLGSDLAQHLFAYQIIIASPLLSLTTARKSRVFSQKTVPQIINTILSNINHRIQVTKTYTKQNLVMQYQINDLDFLELLLKQHTMLYVFFQHRNYCQLLITDNKQFLPQLSANEIFVVKRKLSIKQPPTVYAFSNNCYTQFGCINSDLITAITTIAYQHHDTPNSPAIWQTKLTLQEYPEFNHKPQAYNQTLSALVIDNQRTYAQLDKNSNYQSKFTFDNSRCYNIPFLQACNGLHFPLHNRTAVAVGFINDDLTQPFIYGAINNKQQLSPVNAKNNSQNVIHSWSNNEIIMQDKREHSYLQLATFKQQNLLKIAASQKQIMFKSQQGKLQTIANGNLQIKSQANVRFNCDKQYRQIIYKQQNLVAKQIQLQANSSLNLSAKQNIQQQAKGDINIHAANNLQYSAANSLALQTCAGSIKTTSQKLAIHTKNQLLMHALHNYCYIKQAGHKTLSITPNKIKLHGNNQLSITAIEINFHGKLEQNS